MVPNIFEIEVYVMHLALAWCREHKARGVLGHALKDLGSQSDLREEDPKLL